MTRSPRSKRRRRLSSTRPRSRASSRQLVAEAGMTIAVGEPIAVVTAPGEGNRPHRRRRPGPGVRGAGDRADRRDHRAVTATCKGRTTLLPLRWYGRSPARRGIDLTAMTPGTRPAEPHRPPRPGPAAPHQSRVAVAAPAAGGHSAEDADRLHRYLRSTRYAQGASLRRLTESKTTVPHFYVSADCRVDALLELRKNVNAAAPARVSVSDFVIKAVAAALTEGTRGEFDLERRFDPPVRGCGHRRGGRRRRWPARPVLRGVDRLPISAVAAQVADVAARARRPERSSSRSSREAAFSVSNLGMYGVSEVLRRSSTRRIRGSSLWAGRRNDPSWWTANSRWAP